MKAKKFLVIFCLLAVALFAVACGEEETTTAEPVVTTTAEATTTAATTTKAATTAATTTVAATTKATTKATTAATTTTVATTVAPAPVVPADPYLWNGNVATAFAGGTGTAEDPYQIANGAQLALMAETFEKGAYYILVDDIMLNDVYNWNEWGNGYLRPLNPWTPIEGFNANFDGKGKTIYGLYDIPLFKTTKDASITNIGLAYTDVEGSILIGTATDTNIAGITIDLETLVYTVDGKVKEIVIPENATIDQIMELTGTKWLITLGSNPTVWDFEALAVGALATDIYAANDKLGTAFNVTIVDGKGYVENETDGKKALAWDANDATGNTLILNITKDATAYTNWSAADEVLVYVDGSEQEGAYKFGITIIDAAGKTYTMAKDKEVSILDGKAWYFFNSTGANFELEDGYTGWVRAPFAAFVDADGKAIDVNNINVAQIAFYYENASAVDAGAFYIDAVKILDNDGAWKLVPNVAPTLDPVYGLTMLQDFTSATNDAVRVPDNHKANATVAVKDGQFVLTQLSNSGADAYFTVDKKLGTDVKGFMLYIDASKVLSAAETSQNNKYNTNLHKDYMLGIRVIVDGTAYCAGGTTYATTNVLNQNIIYYQTTDGNWVSMANTNNNRAFLPTHEYTGYVFIPTENMSKNGHNKEFLDDYLATKNGEAVVKEVLLYQGGSVLKDSELVLDNFMAVTGTVASKALPEDLPATLPDGRDYIVFDGTDFNDADEFFTIKSGGALYADKGVDETGAWGIKTAADGGYKEVTISFNEGYSFSASKNDTGFMMYVDFSGVEAKGDYIQFNFGVATFYSEQKRADNESGYKNDGGNYFNFYFGDNNSKENKGKGTVPAYILNEDGEWVRVTNDSHENRVDIPAGYKGQIYIPFTSIYRNGKGGTNENLLLHSSNGFGAMPMIRFLRAGVGNTTTADQVAYIDDVRIVSATEKLPAPEAKDPAAYLPKLPDGADYKVVHQVGFESADEFGYVGGNTTNYSFSTDRAVNGNALSFDVKSASSRAEMYINFKAPLNLEGTKGVLWHVDFSQLDCASDSKGSVGNTITFDLNDSRSNKTDAKAYYLADGSTEWVETVGISSGNDRMTLPNNFVGWVYIPITSYNNPGQLYDPNAGTVVSSDYYPVTGFRVYTEGYLYEVGKYITVDELCYVK